jgi:uncharacterized protein (TIGR00251 family)
MDTLPITSLARGVRFAVRVYPRSSRQRLDGIQEGALKIHLQAPPAEGAANRELVKFLAAVLKTAPSRLQVSSGAHGRHKLIEALELNEQQVREHLLAAGTHL